LFEEKMSQTNIEIEDELGENTFYCAKCNEMVHYFIDKSYDLSLKSTSLEEANTHNKKLAESYMEKYDRLKFEFEEIKADRDDLKEKLEALEAKMNTHLTIVRIL
jgi:hypothetical protein